MEPATASSSAPSSLSPTSSVENAAAPAQPSSSSSSNTKSGSQMNQPKRGAMSETFNKNSAASSGSGTGGNANAASQSASASASASSAKQCTSERMLQLLRQYASTARPKPFTNVRVPHDYVTPCGQGLGAWLRAVGKVRKRGRLPPKLEEELTGLGVVWDGPSKGKKGSSKAKAKKINSEASVPIKREEVGKDDFDGAELANATAAQAPAISQAHPRHHPGAVVQAGPDQRYLHPREDAVGHQPLSTGRVHDVPAFGYGHAPSLSASRQPQHGQPYRAPWAEINDDTTGRIDPSQMSGRSNAVSASAAPAYNQPHAQGHHSDQLHHNDDDDGGFPMADSFDNEYDPDQNPYLYNTSPRTGRSQPHHAAPQPAPHQPTVPLASADHHRQGPSDGLSSLAEASALMEPAGPAEAMVARPSDHPMHAAPSHTNKRKRGQIEPPWRAAGGDSPHQEATTQNTDGRNSSAGGTKGPKPHESKAMTINRSIAGSKPLPKVKGRGRPRCKRAEARLLHADEPLLPERNIARDAPWEDKFDLICEYKRLYGTANVPTAFCSGEVRLGQWLAAQRQARRKGTLGDERVALLEDLGVTWKRNGPSSKNVPTPVQRKPKTHTFIMEPPPPPPEEPPPIDNLSPEEEEHWTYMLGLLKKFRDREGHLYPRSDHVEEGEQLGDWLRMMKIANRNKRLGDSYIKQLAEVGVLLDNNEDTWREFLQLFKEYVAREGTTKVNQAHLEDGKKLGVWVVIQRKHFREGRLSADRIKLLDDAGMDWDPHSTSWEKFYELSVQFALREGHIKVRSDHLEGGEYINRWLRRQKRQKVDGNLTEEQIRRLEQLPGWDWDLGDSFEDMFALLLRFKAKRGHINVPSKHIEEGKKLGCWLDKFKQDKRSGKIDPKMEETLNNLGIQWEILEAQWEQYYLLLLQFVEREGHADVMQRHEEEGERLGIWVATQRSQYKKGKLSQERIERLEQVDFLWEKKRGKTLGSGRRRKKRAKKEDEEASEVSSEGEYGRSEEEDEGEEEEIDYDDEFELDLDGEEADHLDNTEDYHQDDHHHFYYDDGGFGHDAPVKTVGI